MPSTNVIDRWTDRRQQRPRYTNSVEKVVGNLGRYSDSVKDEGVQAVTVQWPISNEKKKSDCIHRTIDPENYWSELSRKFTRVASGGCNICTQGVLLCYSVYRLLPGMGPRGLSLSSGTSPEDRIRWPWPWKPLALVLSSRCLLQPNNISFFLTLTPQYYTAFPPPLHDYYFANLFLKISVAGCCY